MAEQKQPIPFREDGPPSYPPHEHHQRNHHRNQEQNVGGFPNQYFTDVHCGVSITKPVAPPLSSARLGPWTCPKRNWKSAPPCSQATLMADFILSARTMNLDGLSSLWLRNVTTYVLATAGAKIAKKQGESKGGYGSL